MDSSLDQGALEYLEGRKDWIEFESVLRPEVRRRLRSWISGLDDWQLRSLVSFAISEIWISFYRQHNQLKRNFEECPSNFTRWLTGLLKNVRKSFFETKKHLKREISLESQVAESVSLSETLECSRSSPFDHFANRERRKNLLRFILHKMPNSQMRSILFLHVLGANTDLTGQVVYDSRFFARYLGPNQLKQPELVDKPTAFDNPNIAKILGISSRQVANSLYRAKSYIQNNYKGEKA